ncbi:hypothetical protein [Sphaerisporangium sp. NPDC051011]|uniref:hypothetical protein n=1 Tax=Sphaerisporangium sp. NPDC051011 TaxID=3155792 RepID=UPI0033F7F87F
MRPTMVLLCRPLTASTVITRLKAMGEYQSEEYFDRLTVGDCEFGVDLSGSVIDDYDEEELADVELTAAEVQSILIEYRSASCAKTLLIPLLDGLTGFFDTNFGRILSFDEVREEFRRNPEWDWRKP